VSLALDANTAINILRGSSTEVRGRFRLALEAGPIWMSSVVVHELVTGALKSARPTHHLEQIDRLLERLNVAEFTADDAFSAGRVRAELEGAGRGIGALDALIAGQAIARDWIIVTNDLSHFMRVDGLEIIDWTRSDQPINRPDVVAEMLRREK
jgi:tRNA(fMet)-specific endonuclease VapC